MSSPLVTGTHKLYCLYQAGLTAYIQPRKRSIMLYAQSDHIVMESFFPGIENRRLSVRDALEKLHTQPGLIPIAINPDIDGGLVYFADIKTHPLLDWKFIYTIERLSKSGEIDDFFSTDLAILESDDLAHDGLEPDGLIFHVSRCGSTLLTKALGRDQSNLTITQGGPLQEGFWAAITGLWNGEPEINDRNKLMLRNLILLMARKRRPEYRHCFVKFISWNIIYYDLIRATFPKTPALYIYRDPVEVIATVLKETTAVLRAKGTSRSSSLTGLKASDTANMSDAQYLSHCYKYYFHVAHSAAEKGNLKLVNYSDLKHPENFESILERGFGLRPGPEELNTMREQYLYFSKDDTDRTFFRDYKEDSTGTLDPESHRLIHEICGEALQKLDMASSNLFSALPVEMNR